MIGRVRDAVESVLTDHGDGFFATRRRESFTVFSRGGVLTRVLKLGKFVGNEKPEFEDTIQRAGSRDEDARNSAVNGVLNFPVVFWGGGVFENQESVTQTCREGVRPGEQSSQVGEILPILYVGIRQRQFAVFEVLFKAVEELGETRVSDFFKNGGLGEEKHKG